MDAVQTKPKTRQEEIRILGDKELAALLAHLRGHWLYVPVLLTAATGLRRGEVLALRWSDIDFSAATLRVAQVWSLWVPKFRSRNRRQSGAAAPSHSRREAGANYVMVVLIIQQILAAVAARKARPHRRGA